MNFNLVFICFLPTWRLIEKALPLDVHCPDTIFNWLINVNHISIYIRLFLSVPNIKEKVLIMLLKLNIYEFYAKAPPMRCLMVYSHSKSQKTNGTEDDSPVKMFPIVTWRAPQQVLLVLQILFWLLLEVRATSLNNALCRIEQGKPCFHWEKVEGFCHMVMVMVMW